MPRLRSASLFAVEGLTLRRVVCDGVDAPRPVEERSEGARAIVVLRGRFAFRDRDGAAVASPCAALFLRDGQTYDIRHVDDHGDVCVAMRGALVDALVDAGPTTRRLPPHAYLRAQSLAAGLANGAVLSRLAVEETLCDALVSDEAPARGGTRRDNAVADAIAYALERDVDVSLPLVTVAGMAGVSVFHACRAFKRARGTSIHRYHQELRLRHALAMLLETNVPLAQLALDLGFANQPHLTNLFRRRFKTTPLAVRRGGLKGQLEHGR